MQCICKQPEEQRATEDDEPGPSVPLRSEAAPRALKSVNALKALQKLSRKWSFSARPSTSKNDSFEDLEAEARELQTLGKSKSSYCLFPGPTSADQPQEKEHASCLFLSVLYNPCQKAVLSARNNSPRSLKSPLLHLLPSTLLKEGK